jgi:hypothetical protein
MTTREDTVPMTRVAPLKDTLKQNILNNFESKWKLLSNQIIPVEARENNLTIGTLVREFGGDMNLYLTFIRKRFSTFDQQH